MLYKRLLLSGYFPKEIPPVFTTAQFAETANSDSFPISKENGKLINHNVPRFGVNRRRIGIPNPVPYSSLCEILFKNWSTIKDRYNKSRMSKSIPVIDEFGYRALSWEYSHYDLISIRNYDRARSKYILKTDISRFYASVYSHSIPWAIHGKKEAKSKRRTNILGNRIDKAVRDCQDTQTVGIPIGPDTSLIIAEIILSTLDTHLQKRRRLFSKGFRHMDDYEFGFKTYSEAEEGLTVIADTLREFELELNPLKTSIAKLPIPFEPPWISELRHFTFRETKDGQKSDLIRYFNRAFELANNYPNEWVLNYTIGRFKDIEIHKDNWSILQGFILQCIMIENASFSIAFETLFYYDQCGYNIDKTSIDDVMHSKIKEAVKGGMFNEITWAICALIYWKIPMNKGTVNAISSVKDPFVALLALDAQAKNLTKKSLDTGKFWQSVMDKEGLYGEYWLLSYEARKKGWLPSNDRIDHLDADKNYKYLKDNNVEFYKFETFIEEMRKRGSKPIERRFIYE